MACIVELAYWGFRWATATERSANHGWNTASNSAIITIGIITSLFWVVATDLVWGLAVSVTINISTTACFTSSAFWAQLKTSIANA